MNLIDEVHWHVQDLVDNHKGNLWAPLHMCVLGQVWLVHHFESLIILIN